jgi:multicomponent Na+:H+ antiporter subunit G
MTDVISGVLILAGLGFFMAGSLGLLRLPDLYTRLHALTKADNLGLGLVVLGLALQAESLLAALKLTLVWLLVLSASAASAHLIAQRSRQDEGGRWRP